MTWEATLPEISIDFVNMVNVSTLHALGIYLGTVFA